MNEILKCEYGNADQFFDLIRNEKTPDLGYYGIFLITTRKTKSRQEIIFGEEYSPSEVIQSFQSGLKYHNELKKTYNGLKEILRDLKKRFDLPDNFFHIYDFSWEEFPTIIRMGNNIINSILTKDINGLLKERQRFVNKIVERYVNGRLPGEAEHHLLLVRYGEKGEREPEIGCKIPYDLEGTYFSPEHFLYKISKANTSDVQIIGYPDNKNGRLDEERGLVELQKFAGNFLFERIEDELKKAQENCLKEADVKPDRIKSRYNNYSRLAYEIISGITLIKTTTLIEGWKSASMLRPYKDLRGTQLEEIVNIK